MTGHKILLPLDGSDFSREILPQARHFFEPDEIELILLQVAPLPEGRTARPPRPSLVVDEMVVHEYESEIDAWRASHPIELNHELASVQGALLDRLESEAGPLREAGYVVRPSVRFGDPAEEIVTAATDEGVDLIAMATHGRSGIKRLALGSVAEGVLHQAAVPVLLVRPVG